MYCRYCDAALPNGVTICRSCGRFLSGMLEKPAIVCRSCQTANSRDAVFCWLCGKRLRDDQTLVIPPGPLLGAAGAVGQMPSSAAPVVQGTPQIGGAPSLPGTPHISGGLAAGSAPPAGSVSGGVAGSGNVAGGVAGPGNLSGGVAGSGNLSGGVAGPNVGNVAGGVAPSTVAPFGNLSGGVAPPAAAPPWSPYSGSAAQPGTPAGNVTTGSTASGSAPPTPAGSVAQPVVPPPAPSPPLRPQYPHPQQGSLPRPPTTRPPSQPIHSRDRDGQQEQHKQHRPSKSAEHLKATHATRLPGATPNILLGLSSKWVLIAVIVVVVAGGLSGVIAIVHSHTPGPGGVSISTSSTGSNAPTGGSPVTSLGNVDLSGGITGHLSGDTTCTQYSTADQYGSTYAGATTGTINGTDYTIAVTEASASPGTHALLEASIYKVGTSDTWKAVNTGTITNSSDGKTMTFDIQFPGNNGLPPVHASGTIRCAIVGTGP